MSGAAELEELEELYSIIDSDSEPIPEPVSGKVHRILAQHSHAYSSSGSALDIGSSLDEIAEVHELINETLRRECSPVYSFIAELRDSVASFLGKERPMYSAEQLFDRQLRNLRQLRGRLESYEQDAEESLESLAGYATETSDSLVEECRAYRVVRGELSSLAERYQEEEKVTPDVKRDVRQLASRQTLLGQRILFRYRELELLERYEELLSSAAHFSKLVSQNVALVVGHVGQTKQIYNHFGNQLLTVQDMMSATELLGEYLNQLNTSVTESAFALSQQAGSAYHTGAFPQLIGAPIDAEIGRLRDAEFRHHQQIEELVSSILNGNGETL